MYLFPCNVHFYLLLLLMGGYCFYRFAQLRSFRASFFYHYFRPLFVVPYSLPLQNTTSHAARSVLLLTLHTNLNLTQSSSRATKALLQRPYHKNTGLHKNRIPSFPSTSSASVPTRVLRWQHYVITSSSTDTFKIVRHGTPNLRSLARLITLKG